MSILDIFRKPASPVRSVTVEETLQRNVYRDVTDADRDIAQQLGRPIPASVKRLQVMVGGQKAQVDYTAQHRFEGGHLVRAIRRAERWLRANADEAGTVRVRPPRHIALALAAREAILDHGARAHG